MSIEPAMLIAFAVSLFVAALIALLMGSRGGRFRALPGWIVFWVFFGTLLVVLSRGPRWAAVPLLGVVMFASLREYFFLAPVRPQDRWAILLGYLSLPFCLYPVFAASYGLFMAIFLLALFLLMPAVLSFGAPQQGLLDSMGRVLLGMLVYVFSAAHLAWMVHLTPGRIELFGTLVLASELPQRLTGRLRPRNGVLRSVAGAAIGLLITSGLGAWLGPWVGVPLRNGVLAGALVAISVTVGGLVTEAVAQDLALGPSVSRVGRAALLDRITPAIYAAPLFFHFLNRFA